MMNTYFFSFLIPSDLVPGRMSLLITTLLMLINISASAREKSPVSDTFSLIDLWLLTCTIFVAMALFEYAIVIQIRYQPQPQGHSRCTKVSSVTNYYNYHKLLWEWGKYASIISLQIIDRVSFYLFPICFAFLSFAYWTHLDFISFGY